MKQLKIILVAVAAGMLASGCGGLAGMRYVSDNYGNVDKADWEHGGYYFSVFDKPEESRMLITASTSEQVGMELVNFATYGIVDYDFTRDDYRDAAVAWLAKQGRTCEEQDTAVIVKPMWEVKYQCE